MSQNQEQFMKQVARARMEERASSVTRSVAVGLFIAGDCTRWHVYGWLFILILVPHLLRTIANERMKREIYLTILSLEFLFVIVGFVVLMATIILRDLAVAI